MRKHWKIKFALQGVLSQIPGGNSINDSLQILFGDLKNFDDYLTRKIRDYKFFAGHLQPYFNKEDADINALEIGTGWMPLIPVLLSLSGVRSIHTYDKTSHLNGKLIHQAIPLLTNHLESLAEWTQVPIHKLQSKLDLLCETKTTSELFQAAGIHYHAPADAAQTGLPDHSIDFIFSNSVMEHIPHSSIDLIFQESQRILKSDGMAVHAVNCGDHYAYFDRGITQINYLQYSDSEWKRWTTDLLYQNRLRPRDFYQISEKNGLIITQEQRSARAGCQEAFEKLKIAQKFSDYPVEDLVCTSFNFVATPKT